MIFTMGIWIVMMFGIWHDLYCITIIYYNFSARFKTVLCIKHTCMHVKVVASRVHLHGCNPLDHLTLGNT